MEDDVPAVKHSRSSTITVEAEYELFLNNDWTGENPLDFYRLKGTQDIFKRLVVIPKQILCAPATTAGEARRVQNPAEYLLQKLPVPVDIVLEFVSDGKLDTIPAHT
ncbi:hypothetical protein RvY_18514 [Ramazzottius varieornatus]|uniref:Uncharacterized protein n=1 Tax=Ramazzottius varieornatus TaxID=947166 RepID=A0A1D1W9B0_RAMVA|nr:hypothetical protein RvY_18514 [Ramazzottius varieornatus]